MALLEPGRVMDREFSAFAVLEHPSRDIDVDGVRCGGCVGTGPQDLVDRQGRGPADVPLTRLGLLLARRDLTLGGRAYDHNLIGVRHPVRTRHRRQHIVR
ncbi:hypothetical protein ACWEQJ_21275, partial [Streptomyces cyaneofuscatus]